MNSRFENVSDDKCFFEITILFSNLSKQFGTLFQRTKMMVKSQGMCFWICSFSLRGGEDYLEMDVFTAWIV